MDVLLRDGDQALDARGLPRTVEGPAELAQRAMIRLCVPRGRFAPDPTLGSRLYQLPRTSRERMELLAEEYVREALAPMGTAARLLRLSCSAQGGRAGVSLVLALGEETVEMEVTV